MRRNTEGTMRRMRGNTERIKVRRGNMPNEYKFVFINEIVKDVYNKNKTFRLW